MEIVKGYACRDCADAALATRGVDPAKPRAADPGANPEAVRQTPVPPTPPQEPPPREEIDQRRLLDVFA